MNESETIVSTIERRSSKNPFHIHLSKFTLAKNIYSTE